MMPADALLALIAFAFVSSVTPGPNNLMLMTSGANFGLWRTIPHMLGVAIGFVAMVFLVGLGLSRLFVEVPAAYLVLKIASTAYLLYLAWRIATAPPLAVDGTARGRPLTFVQAALFQWVNPKAWTMALTATTAYLAPSAGYTGLIVVAAVFGAINLPSVGLWAAMGVQMRRLLHDPARLRALNIGAAVLLVASLYPTLLSSAGRSQPATGNRTAPSALRSSGP